MKEKKNPYREMGFARIAAVKKDAPQRHGKKLDRDKDLRVK